jgi:hypothetical protein
MIIAKLHGLGIGNMLFHYGAGRWLALKHDVPLKFDCIRTRGSVQIGPTNYATVAQVEASYPCYDLKWSPATAAEVRRVAGAPEFVRAFRRGGFRLFRALSREGRYFAPARTYEFDPRFRDIRPPVFLDSFYMSPLYFAGIEDELRRDLVCRLPMPGAAAEIERQIRDGNSISVHIRRGDYVDPSKTGNLFPAYGGDYARESVRRIEERVGQGRSFVFSDDLGWARENVRLGPDTVYVDHGIADGWVDLELMRRCRHNVITNSSYSWWAAFLNDNPGRQVVCPKVWRNDQPDASDMILGGWIAI